MHGQIYLQYKSDLLELLLSSHFLTLPHRVFIVRILVIVVCHDRDQQCGHSQMLSSSSISDCACIALTAASISISNCSGVGKLFCRFFGSL